MDWRPEGCWDASACAILACGGRALGVPHSSHIGATLRALLDIWGTLVASERLAICLEGLGAVSCCLSAR